MWRHGAFENGIWHSCFGLLAVKVMLSCVIHVYSSACRIGLPYHSSKGESAIFGCTCARTPYLMFWDIPLGFFISFGKSNMRMAAKHLLRRPGLASASSATGHIM